MNAALEHYQEERILYFLNRADGIDRKRGSFRDIEIKRGGTVIAEADLYRFLIDGHLPDIQFVDGDTIVVGRRGATVAVEGAAQNAFLFEIPSAGISGMELMKFARPHPQASHAIITGPRVGGPASIYVPLSDLDVIQLRDGDRVVLGADERTDSILVGVEGSFLGPSRFAVPLDATLLELLDYIEVDSRLADISSVSVRRTSIATRQKKALDDSLRRLETAVAGASSATDEEAKIRAQEVELLSKFIERAREIEPDGVLVVANNGSISDIQLEHGDIVTIPEHTEVVLLSGEVMVPQALIYSHGDGLQDYVNKVGGLSDRADSNRYLVVRRSGEVLQGRNIPIKPGDEIIALPKVPSKNLQIATSITQILFQLALAGATVGALINSL
jgi:protein involved in polysaccharide export with SLBB domain